MSWLQQAKARVQQNPLLRTLWGQYRAWQLLREYRHRRDQYARQARQAGLFYDEARQTGEIRDRLKRRGYTPSRRDCGQIHTFAFIPDLQWHKHLIPDLQELGPTTVFNYVELGIKWEDLAAADARALSLREQVNAAFLQKVREVHSKKPIDWLFVYASGLEFSASTIDRITSELGIPSVNMCLDDKQSWAVKWMGDHRGGQVDICRSFDISWTSAMVATDWYLVEKARPIYLPEGFDNQSFHPMPGEPTMDVSFIGAGYGFRPNIIEFLRKGGVDVTVFGPGWGTRSVWGEEMVQVINHSRINLGMGGIGYSEDLTNVKTRDFEIPGVGGGAYLTSFNPDLAQHYVIGEEILCYRNRDEILELVRHGLSSPRETKEIARRGRERCLREHRWLHRYQKLLSILGISAI